MVLVFYGFRVGVEVRGYGFSCFSALGALAFEFWGCRELQELGWRAGGLRSLRAPSR